MNIRIFITGWCICVSYILFIPFKLMAVPYSGIKKGPSTFEINQISHKEMEKKLGRKMKRKERLAFRWMKRKIIKVKNERGMLFC